jgi:MFS family permease
MRANDRNRAWIVVALLSIFMVINFADKAVIGIAAVPIMQELELAPRQFGLVGSSFFLLFAVSSVATGFLVNRVQTRRVLLAMGFIWALTQFPMPWWPVVSRSGPAKVGQHRWRCIPPTSGSPTNCVRNVCCRAAYRADWRAASSVG